MDQESQTVPKIEYDNAALSALIKKTGEGNPGAFADLYDSTGNLVFGLVLRILADQTVAEEVLVDVYTHIRQESASYDPENFMPLEWIITIARTRAVMKLDSGKEGRKRILPEAGETDPKITVAPALQEYARSSIESLTPSQKEILDWIFYTGLSCSEIAANSGKPLGAVKTYTRLGMSKLYDLFCPLYERGTGSEDANGG